jgi:hypothetical protein
MSESKVKKNKKSKKKHKKKNTSVRMNRFYFIQIFLFYSRTKANPMMNRRQKKRNKFLLQYLVIVYIHTKLSFFFKCLIRKIKLKLHLISFSKQNRPDTNRKTIERMFKQFALSNAVRLSQII